MRSILLCLLLIPSIAALWCVNVTEGVGKYPLKTPLQEERCGPGQVCGLGKHPRGIVKGCVYERACDKGYMRAFNTSVSLWCCGTHKCNSAAAISFVGLFFTAVSLLL